MGFNYTDGKKEIEQRLQWLNTILKSQEGIIIPKHYKITPKENGDYVTIENTITGIKTDIPLYAYPSVRLILSTML